MKFLRSTKDDVSGEIELSEDKELRIGGSYLAHAWDGRIDISTNEVAIESYDDLESFILGLNALGKREYGKGVLDVQSIAEDLNDLEDQLAKYRELTNESE